MMFLVPRMRQHSAVAKAMFACQTDYAICKASAGSYSHAQAALIEAGTRAVPTPIAVSYGFCSLRTYLVL
jgi:hypothetical protein